MTSHDEPDDRTTELLARTLAEEAASVQPSPGALQEIERRTSTQARDRQRTRRRWMIVTPLGAGLAAAAVIFGIVVLNGGTSGGGNHHAVGQPQYTPPAPHEGVYDPNAPASQQFTVYYPGNSSDLMADPPQFVRLYGETHTITDPGADPRLAAVNELLTSTPIDADYRSWLPRGLYATAITTDGEVTTVHLAGDLTPMNIGILPHPSPFGFSQNEGVALQGLLKTMGATDPVAFTYNDEPVDMLELNDVSPSLSPAPDDEVRAFITIDNIVDGQSVANPVTVQVSGNVFEGNVNWTLLDANGAKVDEGFVTTSMGMWTQASVDLGDLDPGTYTFKAFELSAEDGSVINLDDKTFVVQ